MENQNSEPFPDSLYKPTSAPIIDASSFTDGKAKTSAAKAPGHRGVSLRKAAEDLMLKLLGNADTGILHREAQY